MKCIRCGQNLPQNSAFCPKCGTNQPAMPPKKDNNTAILLTVIAILLVIIIISAILIALRLTAQPPTPSPEPTTAAQMTAAPEITPEVIIVTEVPTNNQPSEQRVVIEDPETIVSVMYVVKCNEYITLRTSPSTSASEITKIPLGATVGYMSNASNGFYKVSYNGRTGYALASYLSYTPEVTIPRVQNEAPTTSKMRVAHCDSWISLRSSPSTSASTLAQIPLGATVEYLSSAENGFYKIRYNSQIGYSLSQYLE